MRILVLASMLSAFSVCLVWQAAAAQVPIIVDSGAQLIAEPVAVIFSRAKLCAESVLSNNAVNFRGGSGLFLPADGEREASVNSGGSVVSLADAEAGTIIASQRQLFKFFGVSQVVQSKVSVFIKDGKYKIEHSSIMAAQVDTGGLANSGFEPLEKSPGLVKKATAALKEVTDKLISCINLPPNQKDW